MEGTIGEVRIFAANFSPYQWEYCMGQVMPVSQNAALFAILGSQYGGDGTSTFGLPDLRSRALVCTGHGAGLSPYSNGEKAGDENITLLNSEMPIHTHQAVLTPATTASANVTVQGSSSQSGQLNPGGNLLGNDTGDALLSYASASQGTPVAMASQSIQVSNVNGPQITAVTAANTGGGLSHNNIQPSLALNYIICMYGYFPARD